MIPIRIFAEEQVFPSMFQYLEEYGFDSQVPVSPLTEVETALAPVRIVVKQGEMQVLPDWFNTTIPVLFPNPMPFSKEGLLTLVMFYSGLAEDALNMSKDTDLNSLIMELVMPQEQSAWLESYFKGHLLDHNRAILDFYLGVVTGFDAEKSFKRALSKGNSTSLKAYTAWHYSVFLQDQGEMQEAYDLLSEYLILDNLEESARKALEFEKIRCLKELKANQWTKEELIAYKALIWEVYGYYKDLHAPLLEAQLCKEMALVAQYESNYSEALGYINKCIHVYLAEQLIEMEADAHMFKGALLHQWAKSGAVQFYQQAIKAYQKALYIFKQESTPHLFAHIHHQLGVLYAEMPEEQQKRSIWAAVSATSFKEALSFFKPGDHPFEYASVCHNYATALMSYPDAVRSDNVEKAIGLFREALNIRTESMPLERCTTLLNYLEACWEAENLNDVIERARIKEMQDLALEAFSLAPNDDLKARATQHLNSINQVLEEVAA